MVAAALLVAAAGCAQRAGYVRHVPAPDRWTVVSLDDQGFACRMPGKPIIERATDQDFDGSELQAAEGQLLIADTAVLGFVVMEAEGGFIEDAYAQAQEAVDQSSDSEEVVRDERHFRHEGFLVTDRVLDRPDDGVSFYFRVFLGESRIYGMYVVYPTDAEERMSALVDSFFTSVELDPAQAVTPAGEGMLALDDWSYIYPPESEFAIAMPGTARGAESTAELADLEATTYHYAVGDDSTPGVFEVVVHAFDEEPSDEALEAAREAAMPSGYEPVSERFVHQRGFGGREILLRNGDRELVLRSYATAGRVYTVRVQTAVEPPAEVVEARSKFLGSFRIL